MSASELPAPRFAPASVDASHQIALEIRRYLEREGLQPGDRIGTEQELASEFGVSRARRCARACGCSPPRT